MYARRFILRTGRTTPMLLRSIYIGDGARITKKTHKESVTSHLIRTLPKAKKEKGKKKEQSTRRITYLKICPVAAFC